MDDKFMNYALKEAQKAYNKMDVPVGCVIVHNGKIIARGYNKREKDQNVIKHAEIEAIDKACKALKSWRLNDCTIYTTLFPCPMCASAIQQSRISKLVYLNDTNNKVLNDISLNILFNENLNHRVKIDRNFLENSIIDDFFEKIRKEK